MALVSKTFSQIITFTRASTATYFDSAGVLQSAAIDAPRFDYNPSTLAAQGLLIEESRTNSIRNNTMVGAVAGTPGTLPTNWSVFAANGLATNVVGTGTSSGVNYIDLRINGTSTGTFYVLAFDNAPVAASAGQSWAESFWSAITAGSLSNINSAYLNIRWSGGTADIPFTLTATFTRVSATAVAPAGTTTAVPAIFLSMANSAAIDITLRIGLPQLEQGAFATSVIPTTTTALTRAADVASVNTLSPWYNQVEGSVFAEITQTIESTSAMMPWEANDTTFNNRIYLAIDTPTPGSRRVSSNITTGGVQQTQVFSATLGTTFKTAFAWQTNNVAASQNGSAVQTDTSATIPTVLNFYLGSRTGAGNYLNGYLRRVTYYPRRLSNAELVSITS